MRFGTAGRYVALVVVGWGLLRVFGPAWLAGYPLRFPDSSSYLDVAALGPWSPRFWVAERPPTYPLVIWFARSSPRSIVLLQVLAAVAAWAWLCSVVRRQIREPAVAVVAIGLLVGVAVQSRWAFWHTAVLTESLSSSLAVAGVAAWWRWSDAPDRWRLAVATAITAAWMLLRDSNAVTLAVVVVPALALVVVAERRATGPRRRGIVTALSVLVAVAAVSFASQLATDRGETSFHNNVGKRWLVDPELRDFMVDRGMPLSASLEERAGKDAWADGEAFLNAPELAEYRAWADGPGRRAAVESFVLQAPWYLDRWWWDLPAFTATDHLGYDSFGIADRLPDRPLGPIDPAGSRPAMVVWTALVAAAGVAVLRYDARRAWLLPFLVVPVAVDLYLSYVGDAVEVGRHLVGPLFRWSVVSIVFVSIGVDAAIEGRRRAGA